MDIKQQDINTETHVPSIPLANNKLPIEVILSFTIILVASLITTLFGFLFKFNIEDTKEFIYSAGKSFSYSPSFALTSLTLSFIYSVLILLLLYFVRPSGIHPIIDKNGKNLISLFILSLFGNLAFIVISIFLTGFKITPYIALFLSGILVGVYDNLIYKLYLEQRTFSNHLFWEIFRFAIVGLVAAVFDFLLCFIFQFYVFSGKTQWYVTLVSTAMGFSLGVLINYLMSTFMVYKNTKSNMSKTYKGILLFLFLAIIGLLIGMGLQYFFYDFLNLKLGVTLFSYPLVFVVRTLIVMVYNYISRKVIIYK